MSKRLPVPSELEHLIEKREEETDRRGQKRRKKLSAPQDAAQSARIGERRVQTDRRRKKRRKADS